jgi:hypothetical protein
MTVYLPALMLEIVRELPVLVVGVPDGGMELYSFQV